MTARLSRTWKELTTKTKDAIIHHEHTWKNWAGNQQSTPKKIFRPVNLHDLQKIVKEAKENNEKIRCAAAGHTWSSLSVTSGYLVIMDNVNSVEIKYNNHLKSWTATVGAGIYLKDLDKVLRKHDPPLALDSCVVLNTVTAGGIVATGCHGAKCANSNIPDKVVSLQIVTADGELREFSDDIDKVEMSAARINLGLLGIIYQLTFVVEPMFNIRMIDIFDPLVTSWNAPNLKNLVNSSDSIEVFYWQFNNPGFGAENDRIWIKQFLRTEDMATVSATDEKVKNMFQTLELEFGDHLFEFMAKVPESTPFVSHLLFEAGIDHRADQILEAPDAIHWRAGIDAVPCMDMEFAIKLDKDFHIAIEEFNHVIKRVYEYAEKKKYPMNMSMEFRINKSSRDLLAPTYDPDPDTYFFLLEILSVNGTKDFQEFSIELAQRWMSKYHAQPHWAKLWEHVPDIIPYVRKSLGKRRKIFEEVRKKYDPKQMFFDNETMKKILIG
ncbi:1669_t:CDS:2 [Acaulospora morrowiae]|uniref:D-arabinono-1,4-lactone oxidase n=1 Tax=Acaulospora morrowiae TaxID=94023 RepID=A0A9N9E4W6_9GLOM|nr:1669_t:CDS:2 [Acaulospora morrowiae]